MFSLKGKSAVITGAGSGIGKAIAICFARQGAKVHIVELNADAAAQTIAEIDADDTAVAYSCDVTNQTQVLDTFRQIGRVDILVNNAGIAHVGNVETTTEQDFMKVFDVNVRGAYNCLFAAIPMMKQAGGGVVLNMASI
ncbi:MAG: short-chain dehydrogenase, partial [Pedobacter sp.]|nr:short-chain dehydrogenase [Pedobacter sp.]